MFRKDLHRSCVEVICDCDDDQSSSEYRAASVLFMPLFQTTANNCVLEGMACGLPVVATDVGGIRDYVTDDCAVLCAPGNAQSHLEGILHYYDSRDTLPHSGAKARENALRFSWPIVREAVHGHCLPDRERFLQSPLRKWTQGAGTTMPSLSVIICAHNPRADFLRTRSGRASVQTLPREQWELLLIDNASREPLADRM